MVKPRMKRPGVYEVCQSKLSNAPQALQQPRSEQFDLALSELDEVVDGIANSERFGHCSHIVGPDASDADLTRVKGEHYELMNICIR